MNKKYLFFVFNLLILFVSCKNNKSYSFEAKVIKKEVDNIQIMVDPNVELMMILGRLAGLTPYAKGTVIQNEYLDKVDEYFSKFDLDPVVDMIRKSGLMYQGLPEYGMYLSDDDSKYVMKLNNKNFILVNGPAKENGFYYFEKNRQAIQKFRVESKFDNFFLENTDVYERMIDNNIEKLKDKHLAIWLDNFYFKNNKTKKCIYITYLGGNFGIEYSDKKGNKCPHIVVLGNTDEIDFLYLCSHEFSHPNTYKIIKELYKNDKIRNIFDNAYYKKSYLYNSFGYSSGFYVLNETINQACANKYIETIFTKEILDKIYVMEEEKMQYPYIFQITNFLDDYSNNRDSYNTFVEFKLNLEKFLSELE